MSVSSAGEMDALFTKVATAVRRGALFAALDSAGVDEVVAHLERQVVSAGTVIVRQGEPGETYYLIAEGQVVRYTMAGATSRKPKARRRVGWPDPGDGRWIETWR